ncbi:GHKL domain-containing protein [Ruminococcus sp. AF25-3LB]|nr:GHKL domain-containing protein [Ruminococcus sp. AF25-3LB]RGG30112.1 GHKL domain-containing protein [Ruminococcus sp. AF25-17]RGH43515.1 GHKL domain-containing protein [Ruminococcus sp. AM41-2AC]
MDTNLKSSRKIRTIITIVILSLFAAGIVGSYYMVSRNNIASTVTVEEDIEDCIERMDYSLATGNRILYNEVTGVKDASEQMEMMSNSAFSLFKKYMDYQIFDKEGNPLFKESDDQINEALKSNDSYALKIEYKYGTAGTMSNVTVSGTKLVPEEAYNIEKDLSYYCMDADLEDLIEDEKQTDGISIVYGMTDANYDEFISANQEEDEYVEYNYSMFWSSAALFFLGVLLVAFFLPCIPKVGRYEGKLFHMPFELAVILGISALGIGYGAFADLVYWSFENYHPSGNIMWNTISMLGINWIIWFCLLGVFFCVAESLRLIFTDRRNYWKEHTIAGMLIYWVKKNREEVQEKGHLLKKAWKDIRKFVHHQYEAILQTDLRDKGNKGILRIVILNFLLLLVVKLFSYSMGLLPLAIYSIILFFVMKKVLNGIKKKYQLLLKSTNQLAEGQLDLPIEGDVGIFRPVQDELKKIQSGFKKAVDEEVKNERMKTELVTNVSHDLRTPLTAIITYIDLLKNEKDEEKRKEYTEVLERKSLRLKALIEDLFEMSKAASKTIQMNYMKVDLVGLIRQAELENEEKIREAHLEFRWKLPEDKVVLWLDSEKTYRIFENLIVNITKYAMPHTRVYIEMNERPDDVQIFMKNVSAGELNFNTEEITDRFVRGDSSRNTEGSGLGLAIAKSFAQLQHGNLNITTEADLFKAEIILPKLEMSEKKED